MASGYGLNGGPSRCFPFWQELLGCYVVNAAEGTEGKMKCLNATEDYYECLHHHKEYARQKAMQDAYRKAEASHPRDQVPKAEQISSLGLLRDDKNDKAE